MSRIELLSPLSGWLLPLAEVPDPVFAQGMAGQGLAIDPTCSVLHAPCGGVVLPRNARSLHAVSLRLGAAADLLLHVGIDTVVLGGEGFTALVEPGQRVEAGQPLLRFDLQRVVERAPSAITPIVLACGGHPIDLRATGAVQVGERIFTVALDEAECAAMGSGPSLRRRYRLPFEHGLHARPASQLVAALRPFPARLALLAHGRRADLRSTVALMALGLRCGEVVEVDAVGEGALAALSALDALLEPQLDSVPASWPAPPEVSSSAPPSRPPSPHRGARLLGVTAVHGQALGVAVPLLEGDAPIVEDGESVAVETARLQQALDLLQAHVAECAAGAGGEQAEILLAHLALLDDPQLRLRATEAIAEGRSAEAGWRRAARSAGAELCALADPHLRARAADLRDLERQMLRVLSGEAVDAALQLPERAIVIAEELLPSDFLRLDAGRLAGIVMVRGGATSHVAILAAARGIPTLVAVGREVLGIDAGTPLILDGDGSALHIDPPAQRREALDRSLRRQAEREGRERAEARAPAQTRDGIRVTVLANVGAVDEVTRALDRGAEGCGLLRSEFLYLDRREAPDEATQLHEYRAFAQAFGELPLTVRTLDAGGDKPIAYLPLPVEDNPALGLRGLRTGLRHPELLNTQLRALLRIERPSQLRILLPMVNDPAELVQVRAMLDACAGELGLDRRPQLGVMIETPASALLAPALLREADFLSIGSNDLAQYVLAMDRGHPELAARLDGLHPAVLQLIGRVAEAGAAARRKVSICGSLAADPQALPVLLGLGVREFSVVANAIPRLKAEVRRMALDDCVELAGRALTLNCAADVRELVRHWPGFAAPISATESAA